MKYLWSLHRATLSSERINASIWNILSAVKFFKLRACVKALARSVFCVLDPVAFILFAARSSATVSARAACLFFFWLTDRAYYSYFTELLPDSKPYITIPNSSETIVTPCSLTTISTCSYRLSSFFSSLSAIGTFRPIFYASSPVGFKLDFLRFSALPLCVLIILSGSAIY